MKSQLSKSLAAILLSITISIACSEESLDSPQSIVGEWVLVKTHSYGCSREISETVNYYVCDEYYCERLVFGEDGSYRLIFNEFSYDYEISGTYSVDDNKLIMNQIYHTALPGLDTATKIYDYEYIEGLLKINYGNLQANPCEVVDYFSRSEDTN